MSTAPSVVASPETPYQRIGGAAVIEAITERFYDVMDSDPAYARLRAMHAPDLGPMRRSLAGFLTGWSGGPGDWFVANPGKCVMSAHRAFAIDREVAAQWVSAMQRAIADVAPADRETSEALADVLGRMAQGMVDR